MRRRPDLADVPLVRDWPGRGWPVIVRRRMAGDGADDMPAALPLPPSHSKRRIAFSLPPGPEVTALPPVLLRDAAPAAPVAWQTTIAALAGFGDGAGLAPRVFGALLWEAVTGLPYLTARSDLDLLWDVADEAAAGPLLQLLHHFDAAGPVRLDGELVLPDGAGVNWRELDRTVLAKTMHGVEERCRAELFRSLAPAR